MYIKMVAFGSFVCKNKIYEGCTIEFPKSHQLRIWDKVDLSAHINKILLLRKY